MLQVVERPPAATFIVVTSHPHREQFALENLARQGFVTYCPMIVKRIRHARRAYDAKRPLFPGYLFIAYTPLVDRWRSVLGTYGVRSVVRNGDTPALLDADFVDALRAREIDGVVRKPDRPFEVGQRVAINGGAFDGIIAEVVELQDNERVLVLLQLLNGAAKARLSETDLRLA